MMLEEVLRDLSSIDGIVMYSIFMLPESRAQRYRIYDILFNKNISLHGALENINIDTKFSVEHLEEVLLLQQLMYEQSNDTIDYLNNYAN
jgi:sporadic carbohydrate cluster protein (TIGR04323 family)